MLVIDHNGVFTEHTISYVVASYPESNHIAAGDHTIVMDVRIVGRKRGSITRHYTYPPARILGVALRSFAAGPCCREGNVVAIASTVDAVEVGAS